MKGRLYLLTKIKIIAIVAALLLSVPEVAYFSSDVNSVNVSGVRHKEVSASVHMRSNSMIPLIKAIPMSIPVTFDKQSAVDDASKTANVTAMQSKHVDIVKVPNITSCEMKLLGDFTLTGYCPCKICCEQFSTPADVKCTSIGVHAYEGVTVAVDPSKIPYGTKLYIEGYGIRIASDCGGAIKGNHLDIYFRNHSDAEAVGVKSAKVWRVDDQTKVK